MTQQEDQEGDVMTKQKKDQRRCEDETAKMNISRR